MRILFVENHATFAETVRQRFLSEHEVVIVPSLAAARLELGGAQFGAALVDYDLDDGKGDALVRELIAGGFNGRVIAVSAHDDGNAALLRAGADAACPKTQFDRIALVLASTGSN